MVTINKVVLIGRLTKDTELNFAANSGTAVCRFSLAVTRPFKKDETDFINCIAFGKTGETIAQYFSKGKPIALVGAIRTGSYDAKDGSKRYTTDVVVDSFEFVGGNGEKKEQVGNQEPKDPFGDTSMNGLEPVVDESMPF
ncbi:MAG: single-stranded DNA-binding protein [Peptostreptococcaceae bacterium]